MPFVQLRDGRIQSVKLEYNLVDHCNYACEDCSHLSPWLRPRKAGLESFRADLAALARVYHVRRLRFVGGEPFLHPELLGFVRAARESGVADQIQICTNGSLVDRVDEAVFGEIDLLSVSWYPDARLDEEKVARIRALCRRYGTRLRLERIDRFRAMRLDHPNPDPALVQEVYDTCQIAHAWYCQTFADGVFYLCSRPLYTNAYLDRKGLEAPNLRALDGVPLHTPDLQARLLASLGTRAPLASCAWCLGTVGRYQPWRSLDAAGRADPSPLSRVAQEQIDPLRLRWVGTWARAERAILRRAPSLRIARAMTLARSAVIRD